MNQRSDDHPGHGPSVEQLVADHQRTIEELRSACARISGELMPRISALAATTHPLLIPWRPVIDQHAAQAQTRVAEIERLLRLLLPSWSLPIRMWRTAAQWVPVRAMVGSVAGDLGVTNREVHVWWHGIAAETYAAVVPAHAGAASRLAAVADAAQFALNWAASAVARMYLAVLGLVLGFIGAVLVALGAAVTGTGILAAIVILLMVAGTVLTLLSDIIVASATALGTAQTWVSEMASEMADTTAFPGGQWPAARPEWFADATTSDGDPSDWTVR